MDLTSSISENVALELRKPIFNKGYTIYLNDWYMSPTLFSKLLQLRTHAVDTVSQTIKHMQKWLVSTSTKLTKGEFVAHSCNNVLNTTLK